jgi:hypothetical protein
MDALVNLSSNVYLSDILQALEFLPDKKLTEFVLQIDEIRSDELFSLGLIKCLCESMLGEYEADVARSMSGLMSGYGNFPLDRSSTMVELFSNFLKDLERETA